MCFRTGTVPQGNPGASSVPQDRMKTLLGRIYGRGSKSRFSSDPVFHLLLVKVSSFGL